MRDTPQYVVSDEANQQNAMQQANQADIQFQVVLFIQLLLCLKKNQ